MYNILESFEKILKEVKKKAKLGSGKRFKELKDNVAKSYEKKGKSKEEAEKIGAAVAAKQGIKKYGKKKMLKLSQKVRKKG